ncbi:hypothetical protein LPIBR_30255 [Lacticaseibacillus paracasei]|nr:hypothetical protein LPIBR_30255 [Lacticaseibacillus paracasei]
MENATAVYFFARIILRTLLSDVVIYYMSVVPDALSTQHKHRKSKFSALRYRPLLTWRFFDATLD